ncbi:MAG: hypothetical protein U0990_10935 [Candidatus Nanopelagicales bacterium]|nr:hypothetical protein [Candidatus Nanopelagicales bacterium]MDZ4250581.1 hypothetical protein [Candidatus Nanopelagicales bacterium]
MHFNVRGNGRSVQIAVALTGALLLAACGGTADDAVRREAGPREAQHGAEAVAFQEAAQPSGSAEEARRRSRLVGGKANGPSPSGCRIKSHNPHLSHHKKGRVNVGATAKCEAYVSALHAESQLQETAWYGWADIGVPGSKTILVSKYVRVYGHDKCHVTATYRGKGYGRSIEKSGTYERGKVGKSWYAVRCTVTGKRN